MEKSLVNQPTRSIITDLQSFPPCLSSAVELPSNASLSFIPLIKRHRHNSQRNHVPCSFYIRSTPQPKHSLPYAQKNAFTFFRQALYIVNSCFKGPSPSAVHHSAHTRRPCGESFYCLPVIFLFLFFCLSSH